MRSTVLRRSLLDRLVVISRKSHGLRSNKLRLFVHSVLPSPTKEDARVAVEMLFIHSWPSSHMCQAVKSLASLDCLHMCMPHQLTRLHQVISESPCNTTGTTPRLDCLSALLPALAACPSLHTTAQEALHEIITSRRPLTTACEQSILSVYASNTERLVDVMKLARSSGHQFSRTYYRTALGKAMEQESGRPLPLTKKLLQMMTGDHSKEEVQADLLWVALHLARDPVQVKAIIQDIQTSCLPLDEGLSIQLMKTCLRTSVSLAQDHSHSNTNANPSQAVSALVACLAPQNATVSAAAFERVLTACADTCQLTQAVVTFMCMTHTHQLAPTRVGLSSIGRLLYHPLLTANHLLRKLRLGVCYHTLSATIQAYGGQPPAWVYVECARPFTELLGLKGYQLMHDLCEAVLFKEHGEARGKVILNDLWNKEHYHQLLAACQVNHTLELGTFLLQEMIKKEITPDSDTVSLLLHFHGDKFNIDNYIIKIVQFIDGLSTEKMGHLQKPFYSSLNKSLTHTMSERMREPLICDAVNQLLSVGSQSWSIEQCIRQLASYGRNSSGHHSTSLLNASCVASIVDYDTVLFRRATA